MSCHLIIDFDGNQVKNVIGNTCPRGVKYANSELLNPLRMITSTVVIRGAIYQRLPVISDKEIPKNKMFEVMEEINKVVVNAPVMINQTIIKNVCNLGVDIISSRTMELK